MTNLTKEEMRKISSLAKIEITEDGQEAMAKQVGGIISWINQLSEVDTSQVEPLVSICNSSLLLNKDEVNDGNIHEDILKNAKNAKYGYFSVPKVIE